jgi:PAS domain S-box-containing protein
MNAVAESLTGWKARDAVGEPLDAVFRIVNEDTRQPVDNPAAKVLRGGVDVGLVNHSVLIRRDGAECPIDDSATPILDERGLVSGCVLIFRDVSAQRRLSEVDRRKNEFLAMLAHELRNPLAPISNAARMLRLDGRDGDTLRSASDTLDRQVRQLARLVDDLLDMSRITRGTIELRKGQIELMPVVHQAVETVRPLLQQDES